MRQGRRKKKKGRRRPSHRASSSTPAPISLCMIVKNEERHLPGCLESVAGLVSEMILVDTGSTDNTLQVAAKHHAKILQFQWENHFSRARNYALSQASQPWILYLDADERLHPEYHDAVRKAVRTNRADAYYLQVFSEVGNALGGIPHVQAYPRLFRKLPGVQFEGRIHEQITPSLQKVKARFGYLDVKIEHLGYNLPDTEIRKKIERNLSYLEAQIKEEPENPYARYQYGQTVLLAGRKDEGIEQLRKVIELCANEDPLALAAQLIIANEFFLEAEYQSAIELIRPVVEVAPRQRLGWFLLSECYANLQEYPRAIETLLMVEKHLTLSFTDLKIDKLFDKHLIYQRLGLYSFLMDDVESAVSYWVKYFMSATRLRVTILTNFLNAVHHTPSVLPKVKPVFRNLIDRLRDFDDPPEAIHLLASFFEEQHTLPFQIRLFQEASRHYPDQAIYRYYLGNAFLANEQFGQAEKEYRRALQLDSNVYEIYYNLAVTAIKQRNYEDAIHWFLSIKEKFPEHREMATRRLTALYLKTGDMESVQHLVAEIPVNR